MVGGGLSDDIGDIAGDLADGLARLEAGSARDALWEWHFRFWNHWGKHAFEALCVLHLALVEAGGPPPEESA